MLARFPVVANGAAVRHIALCTSPSRGTVAAVGVYAVFAAAVAAINTCALVDVVRAVISIPTIFANAIAIAVLTIATILAGS